MADRFTRAGDNIWLLPSSLAGETYKRGGMEFAIATVPGVRKELKEICDRAYARSQAKLAFVRARLGTLGKRIEQGVTVEKARGRIDSYLILNDNNSGTPGAISIELGRGSYTVTDEETGEEYEVSGMEGVGILHAGFDMNPGSLSGTGGGDIPSGV